jgi:hypothetical protein
VAVINIRNDQRRFLGTKAAAVYSGIPAGTLRAWRCQGIGPKFYKPRGRALYDIADLDEFIQLGIHASSVRASREEPWKESGALNSQINLYGFWNEQAFLTKSGDAAGMIPDPSLTVLRGSRPVCPHNQQE